MPPRVGYPAVLSLASSRTPAASATSRTEAGERCHAEAVPTHRDVLARLLPASMLSAASSGE
jgi:hypothetical protein